MYHLIIFGLGEIMTCWVLLLHKVFDYDLAYSAFKFQVFMLHKVYIPGLSFHGHFYILSDDFIKRALICI